LVVVGDGEVAAGVFGDRDVWAAGEEPGEAAVAEAAVVEAGLEVVDALVDRGGGGVVAAGGGLLGHRLHEESMGELEIARVAWRYRGGPGSIDRSTGRAAGCGSVSLPVALVSCRRGEQVGAGPVQVGGTQ
jgi:hypothetical protein